MKASGGTPKATPKAAPAQPAKESKVVAQKNGKALPAPASKSAKPAGSVPGTLTILAPVPPTQAPKKFQREYRRWKELLISLRHRLLSEGSHLEEEGLKALEQEVSVDHMADFGSDSYEQETTLQLMENNSLSLRDVDEALKRIEIGNYGLCEDCEALIPSARLAVLPHARLCIACQTKREGAPA